MSKAKLLVRFLGRLVELSGAGLMTKMSYWLLAAVAHESNLRAAR